MAVGRDKHDKVIVDSDVNITNKLEKINIAVLYSQVFLASAIPFATPINNSTSDMKYKQEIQASFDKVAQSYRSVSLIQREVGKRLLERLSYLQCKPERILDLGCGSGELCFEIKRLFPKAKVLGCDISSQMLHQAREQTGWLKKPHWFTADMEALPLANASIDLVISNQAIHWSPSQDKLFSEVNRVLSEQGVFMFSTMGPDSFAEIRQAWQGIDEYQHVNHFVDMHDIGDALMRAQLLEPVVDMEMISLMYPDCKSICKDLKAQGVRNIHSSRQRGLTSRARWRAFENNYQRFTDQHGRLPLSYEIVYGHAFSGQAGGRMLPGETEVSIPLSEIPIR